MKCLMGDLIAQLGDVKISRVRTEVVVKICGQAADGLHLFIISG